ncbi:uncharacterized protein BDR25DRAFT_355716 [Lindgomyces ingoldianus]|uniref:Uncharacterized protein n=1 Tax=Lindgomyces ingoldianus TaxID=673940 RepID=A0ACB6QUP2_9PLEO|nr:uncharacterized protein BDR25DRAFT_355716 [Lindgomyces ingoldianus]KAF2469992.1 hypothetical protein BDR25DRAFT_355716 [Lindgomyces ingoldianus]
MVACDMWKMEANAGVLKSGFPELPRWGIDDVSLKRKSKPSHRSRLLYLRACKTGGTIKDLEPTPRELAWGRFSPAQKYSAQALLPLVDAPRWLLKWFRRIGRSSIDLGSSLSSHLTADSLILSKDSMFVSHLRYTFIFWVLLFLNGLPSIPLFPKASCPSRPIVLGQQGDRCVRSCLTLLLSGLDIGYREDVSGRSCGKMMTTALQPSPDAVFHLRVFLIKADWGIPFSLGEWLTRFWNCQRREPFRYELDATLNGRAPSGQKPSSTARSSNFAVFLDIQEVSLFHPGVFSATPCTCCLIHSQTLINTLVIFFSRVECRAVQERLPTFVQAGLSFQKLAGGDDFWRLDTIDEVMKTGRRQRHLVASSWLGWVEAQKFDLNFAESKREAARSGNEVVLRDAQEKSDDKTRRKSRSVSGFKVPKHLQIRKTLRPSKPPPMYAIGIELHPGKPAWLELSLKLGDSDTAASNLISLLHGNSPVTNRFELFVPHTRIRNPTFRIWKSKFTEGTRLSLLSPSGIAISVPLQDWGSLAKLLESEQQGLLFARLWLCDGGCARNMTQGFGRKRRSMKRKRTRSLTAIESWTGACSPICLRGSFQSGLCNHGSRLRKSLEVRKPREYGGVGIGRAITNRRNALRKKKIRILGTGKANDIHETASWAGCSWSQWAGSICTGM